jgi:hypothetical protein
MKPEITGPIDRINQDRFEFFMVGEINYWVVLHRDQTPERFPHGTSVLVLGCPQKQNLNALGVIKLDENRQIVKIYWRDGILDNFDSCPFPVEPE